VYDEKKVPITVDFTRCGKYEVVIHTFSEYPVENISFSLNKNDNDDEDHVIYGKWTNKDIDNISLYWCESTVNIFIKRKVSMNFVAWHTTDRESQDAEFYIELHYKS